jgi:ketosteroid isomerase-like protein
MCEETSPPEDCAEQGRSSIDLDRRKLLGSAVVVGGMALYGGSTAQAAPSETGPSKDPEKGEDRKSTPQSLEQRVREIEDRNEVRDLTHRYCDMVWRKVGAPMADLFTDDGVLLVDGQREVAGRAALQTWFSNLTNNACPYIHNHVITITGDTAKARCYVDNRMGGDGSTLAGGYYEDEFRRTPQGWKFLRRHFNPIWRFVVVVQSK